MISASQLSIDCDRLLQSIEKFAQIGQLPLDPISPRAGVCRIAYSPEDLQARQQVQQWMLEAGMQVRIDPAGNIIGRYPGQIPHAPALATGSHIDTVPVGGRYDGAFGVLAGLEVVRVLQAEQIQLAHPVEVIVFTDEEGSMLGSKAISGRVKPDESYYRRPEGTEIQTCLERVGGNWNQIAQARRNDQDIAAFVELHVEQGPVLESAGVQIGVVEGIVGQRRYMLTIQGQASHAGTTPMSMRKDALLAASQAVIAVNQLANMPGQQVATVGKMALFPNAPNVIPGRVEMSLDIRDLSNSHLDQLMTDLERQLEAIATTTQTQIHIEPSLYNEPALAQPQLQQIIVEVCESLGLSYLHLPSRASHDAQEMATFTDMAMIFVPSIGGISHSTTEYTSPEQCAQGANVLLHTLLRLDQAYLVG